MIAKQLRLNRKLFIEVRKSGTVHKLGVCQIYLTNKYHGMAVVVSGKNNSSAIWRNTIRRYFYDTLKIYAQKTSFIIYFYTRVDVQNYKSLCATIDSFLSKVLVV